MKKMSAICLLAACAGISWLSYSMAYRWTIGPRLDVPSLIDLGVQDPDQEIESEFLVRNIGSALLELTNFETSCHCLSLQEKAVSSTAPLERKTISPGCSLTLVARLKTGTDSQKGRSYVWFDTNDPSVPQARVEISMGVQGRVVLTPAQVYFGQLVPNETVTHSLVIIDSGRIPPVRVTRVESSAPDFIRVTRFETDGQAPLVPSGRLIGELKVEIRAPKPGRVEERLSFYEEGNVRPIAQVPIRGEVVLPFQVSPSVLLLPRAASDGWDYSVRVLCQTADRKPFRLSVIAPPSLTVQVEGEDVLAATHVACVLWHPDRDPPAASFTGVIRFAAISDGEEKVVEVPVTCRRPQ
jgi:hypothetical protein